MTLFVVQMHGEPGSGKSTLARAIGRELPAVVLDKDIISSAMLRSGQATGSTGPSSYLALYSLARSVVEQGYSVVIDSPCFWPSIEEHGRGIANATHARYAMIECVCPPQVIDERLATRERLESNPAARMTGPLILGMRAPTCQRLILDSTRPVTDIAAETVAYIRSLATVAATAKALAPSPSPDPAGEGSRTQPLREPGEALAPSPSPDPAGEGSQTEPVREPGEALTPSPSPDPAGEGSQTQPLREPQGSFESRHNSSPSPAKSGEGVGG